MTHFIFRGQAALAYRRRQDEAAQRALAVARTARIQAETALRAAERALGEAIERASTREATAAEIFTMTWHRDWIRSRQRELSVCRRALAQHQAEEQQAAERAGRARRDLRALEGQRARARRSYERELYQSEQRSVGLVGGMHAPYA